MIIHATLPKRGTDAWGSGEYQASRNGRRHKGIDYACYPGTVIRSPVMGSVTKLGYPYSDDLHYRYVEVTDHNQNRHRAFYVEPIVRLDDPVQIGDPIGEAQDIAGRYSKPEKIMLNHIHFEILEPDGSTVDPEGFVW